MKENFRVMFNKTVLSTGSMDDMTKVTGNKDGIQTTPKRDRLKDKLRTEFGKFPKYIVNVSAMTEF